MGPSNLVANQIMFRSAECNEVANSFLPIKKEIEKEADAAKLLELNNLLKLKMRHVKQLHLHLEDIIHTFRTFSPRSPRLEKAEECFYQGQLSEMDKILDYKQIEKEIEALDEKTPANDAEEKALTEQLTCLGIELVVKALYHYTFVEDPEWHETVYECLDLANEANNCSPHALYELGVYLLLTEEKKWAVELLEDAEILSENLGGEAALFYRAKSLTALATLPFKKEDYAAAIEYDSKAVKIYTELCQQNPAEYRSDLAEALKRLAFSHVNNKNYAVGAVIMEERLRVQREIIAHSGDNFPFRMETSSSEQFGDWEGEFQAQMQLAETLAYLASIHTALGEFPQALERYEERMQILNANMDVNIYTVLEEKAKTLRALGIIYIKKNDAEAALKCFLQAVEISQQVQDIDPIGQLPRIIEDRDALAKIYRQLQRLEDALREREKIVKLYKILYEQYPELHILEALSEAVNLRTNHYGYLNKNTKYRTSLLEAIDFSRKLAAEQPESILAVAVNLANLSYIYKREGGRRKEMLEAAQEAYDILAPIERGEFLEDVYVHVKQILNIND